MVFAENDTHSRCTNILAAISMNNIYTPIFRTIVSFRKIVSLHCERTCIDQARSRGGGGSRGSGPRSISHLWVGQKPLARPLARHRGSRPDLDPPPPALKVNPGYGPVMLYESLKPYSNRTNASSNNRSIGC